MDTTTKGTCDTARCVIGVDVSKDRLDLARLPAEPHLPASVTNDPAGHAELVSMLGRLQPRLIVLEATGGYEQPIVAELQVAGLPVACVNPRQVRDLAKALGVLAKTDAVDARVLAEFARRIDPPPTPAADETTVALKALLARRRELIAMRTAEKNRLQQARAAKVRASIETHIAHLNRQLDELDQDTDRWVRASPVWREREELIVSTPGMGSTSARQLLTAVPELGTLSRQAVAALGGLAPMNRDSGRHRGPRHTGGGRSAIRCALYMPTLTATRHNPVIRAQYERLLAAGKGKRVALVACMRKLLILLNAMLRERQPWRHASETA